ncbi:MAG: hypothetical protein RBT63_00430 [Bdellovibrionales bacterium]|jgi:hypothetical protein|nr:hypothetical protein [Bdellovibrionales bacterium]
MSEIFAKLPEIVELLAYIVLSIVMLASAIAHLTSWKEGKEYSGKVGGWVNGILSRLPTVGLNPQTKKLQEAYKELQDRHQKELQVNAVRPEEASKDGVPKSES